MSPSEIAFLALGAALGAAVGVVLARGLPGGHGRRREVRLTITPNAIPAGRTRTLAVPHGVPHPGLIPGSPEEGALADALPGVPPAAATPAVAALAGAGPIRTRVLAGPLALPSSAVAIPVGRAPGLAAGGAGAGGQGPVPSGAPAGRTDASPGAAPIRVPTRAAPGGTPRATAVHPPAPARNGSSAGVAVLAPPVAGTREVLALPAPQHVAAALAIPTPTRDGRGDPFTTLVRPRPPVDDARVRLAADAVPVAVAAPPVTRVTVRAPLPETRLARPSAPTLTRPPLPPAAALRPIAMAAAPEPVGPGTGSTSPSAAADPDAPCAGPRRLVEERCALANVAREQARAALDALREAQRAYDVLRERVDRAQALADPRHVAAEKDRLHADFRAATERAGGPDETEAAARAWLDEINRLNGAVREAHRVIDAGGAELRAAHPTLERLSAEADAARIAAENADAGCREAREELAGCEEAQARAARTPPAAEEPHPFDRVWPVDRPELTEHPAPPVDLLSGLPAIVRILRGDRDARERLVASLAADDPSVERGEWQLRISRLVDAIVGRAIEDGYLDLPGDDPFWRLFETRESRDIVGALSALGFRYDGLGGFADGRVPAARDLSLAVGYAGLDRMRIRTWPREADIAALYARAVVAADEWLADAAGDLTLGRMVDALGGRAAELADVWNAWGRVRPALLAS